jgi:ribosomal protein S18 acetylase RimI-like enzyme
VHSAEILFNRIVPVWLFRFSMGTVFKLDCEKLCHALDTVGPSDLVMQCVDDTELRDRLRKTTWNSVPIETSANHYGYAIYRNEAPDKILGGVWGGIERFNEADLGFQIQLRPEQSWIYCAYVAAEARGEGVYKRVLSFAARDLREKGHDELRVIVQPWNRASMAIHRKYSNEIIGRITVIRVFALAIVFCSGQLTKSKTCTTELLTDPVRIDVP